MVEVTITSIYPLSGIQKTMLTITGTGFDPMLDNNLVSINGQSAKVMSTQESPSSTETKLTVIVPRGAGTGPVSVTAYAKTVDGPIFTYELSRGYTVNSTNVVVSDLQLGDKTSLTYDSVNNILYASAGSQGIKGC